MPGVALAENDPVDASPEESVVTVIVFVVVENTADAPLAGAVNVTLTPATGFPSASST